MQIIVIFETSQMANPYISHWDFARLWGYDDLKYCTLFGGLEANLQYLWGMSVILWSASPSIKGCVRDSEPIYQWKVNKLDAKVH